jgi:hypothetical protein
MRKPWFPALGGLNRLIHQLAASGSRLQLMLLQLKWPPPGHLPAALLDEIASAFEKEDIGPSDVERLFVTYYTPQRLRQLVAAWSERGLSARRLRIMEQVVSAHCEGRFELSVPSILPQIEGTIAEIFGHAGRISGKEIRQYVKAVLQRGSRFDKIGAAFFTDVLLDRFEWGDPIPPLSRHAILHGADLDYMTAANSLRLILSFDQLQGAMQYVATPTGKKYHSPNCAHIQSKRKRRVFRDAAVAATEGCTPCSHCLPYTTDPS